MSPTQKLQLKRQYDTSPGVAFLNAVELIRKECEESIKGMRKDMAGMLLTDIITEMKGQDGEDADPHEIAEILLESPDFIKKVKARDGHTPSQAEVSALIKKLLPKVENGRDGRDGRNGVNGKDGKTPTEEELTALMKKCMPKTEAIMQKLDMGDLAEKIARAMEALPYPKKLDYDTGLKNKPGVQMSSGKGGRLGRGTGNPTKYYDLSSLLDGVTKTFAIPANLRVLDVRSSSAPFAFRQTTDYTYTATSLTFTSEINAASTLKSGQTIYIIYVEA